LNIQKVFGPPGSGKTTFLLNEVEKELASGVDSTRIGYFSFTRKAANEAKERAIIKFPHLHEKRDFPYFRTLHSLAYMVLGTNITNMMSAEHYKEFAQQTGLEIGIAAEDEVVKADHPILNEINIARIKNIDLREHYNNSGMGIEWHHFEFVERSYRHYKTAHDLIDFTDLLELAIGRHESLPALETVIIDEAQDLSRLQWQLVEILATKAKRTYIAGDDDQAIHLWAGADVSSFLAFTGTIRVLEKSYRVPQAVHTIANRIVNRIKTRQEKKWDPRSHEGSVQAYSRFEDVAIDDGQWLIMASAGYMLNPICEWLRNNGTLFERQGVSSISPDIVQSVRDWEHLRKGGQIGYENVRRVYRYLGSENVARGHRTFKKGDEYALYTLEELKDNHGLLTDAIWHVALEKISEDKKAYMIAVLRRGQKFSETSRIKVSTIHGAKGGEADNVMLLLDLSPKSAEEYWQDSDNINRLFYVGVTRPRESLHLVMPRRSDRGFQL